MVSKALYRIIEANTAAESASWWMKGINLNEIDDLGVMSKIQDVIERLRQVDNLTIDIAISIQNKD